MSICKKYVYIYIYICDVCVCVLYIYMMCVCLWYIYIYRCQFIYDSLWISIYPSICIYIYVSICLSIALINLPVCPICQSIYRYFHYLPTWVCIHIYIYTFNVSIYQSVCQLFYIPIALYVRRSSNPSTDLFDLPIYQPIYLSMYIYIYIHTPAYYLQSLSFHLSIYQSIYQSIYLSIYQSIYLSIYPSIYLSIHVPIHQSIYLYTILIYPIHILFPFYIFASNISYYQTIQAPVGFFWMGVWSYPS